MSLRQILPVPQRTTQKRAGASRSKAFCGGGAQIAVTLMIVSLCSSSCLAQTDGAGEVAHAQPHALNIVILEGEGALNNIRERDAREPIVQVQDENHKPVAGALVLFAINDSGGGAGAAFNGLQTLSVTTGPDGIARAEGFQANHVSGRYTLSVKATFLTMAASTVVYEANIITPLPGQSTPAASPASQGFGHTIAHSGLVHWVIAGAVVGGAAAAGAIYSSNGGGGTSIKPGNGSVGPPGP